MVRLPLVGPETEDSEGASGATGLYLILAAALAMICANSPLAPLYQAMLALPVGWGNATHPLLLWVNDGLMSLFFLLAGLEIRREMAAGHLATWRRAAGPGIAALGGMVCPAAIYLTLNHANAGTVHGWAVPIATDIAFSLSVLRLIRRPGLAPVRAFLTGVAIIDDLGAIVVITVIYSHHVEQDMLRAAGLAVFLLAMLRQVGIRGLWAYWLISSLLWFLLFRSGVEATLAGVAMAFTVPGDSTNEQSPSRRLERHLEPYVYYAVLPVFGFFNAGMDLRGLHGATLLTPAPVGVFLGLAVGKQAGVFLAAWLGRLLGILTLPPGMGMRGLYGAALLCGIGFTMSLFIAHLAFPDSGTSIRAAVLAASILSALCGAMFLRRGP
jgi:NhaA family Na+:H+ antiporter